MNTPRTNTYGGTRIQHLEPRFHPLPINTCRRVYLQNLTNLLHTAIAKGDGERAYKAWSILVRCPELDLITTWKHALPVFHLLQKRGGRDPSAVQRDSPYLDDAIQEQYLRKIMLLSPDYRRLDAFTALIIHLIAIGAYERALEDLELYLPSFPYAVSPILHTYAALISLHLAQPIRSTTQNPELFASTPRSASNWLDGAPVRHAGDHQPENQTFSNLLSQYREPAFSSSHVGSWDVRSLKKAQSYLKQAVRLEEDELKGFADDAANRTGKPRKQKGVGKGKWDRSDKIVQGPFPERAQSAARGYLLEVQKLLKTQSRRRDSGSERESEESSGGEGSSIKGQAAVLQSEGFPGTRSPAGTGMVHSRSNPDLHIDGNQSSEGEATERGSDTSIAPSFSASNIRGGYSRTASPAPSMASSTSSLASPRSRRSTRNPRPEYRMSAHPLDAKLALERREDRSHGQDSRSSTPGQRAARRARDIASDADVDSAENRRYKRARNVKADDGSSTIDHDSRADEKGDEDEEYSDMSIG